MHFVEALTTWALLPYKQAECSGKIQALWASLKR